VVRAVDDTTASQAEPPRPRKARGLRQRGPIEPIEQADFLRVPRPKLLQPWSEDIELSASGCLIVQVLDHLDGRIIVGLPFGGDECLDMLPELVDVPDQAIQVAGARRCLCTGKLLTLALCLFDGGACAAPPPGVRRHLTIVRPCDLRSTARNLLGRGDRHRGTPDAHMCYN
jgi:hypothetical protein